MAALIVYKKKVSSAPLLLTSVPLFVETEWSKEMRFVTTPIQTTKKDVHLSAN